ncbi:unnamed protein product [Owenia fusiformis]|uniref:Uncharacterized protein n=1 Tax=Owenia fusiformis TaxID=6347 RepID=A0A8J1UXT1_OWEFU|nr:unnamed protein product [Owenia fusiformis]
MGGYLAKPETVLENDFVRTLIHAESDWVFWFGANDNDVENQWKWTDGVVIDSAVIDFYPGATTCCTNPKNRNCCSTTNIQPNNGVGTLTGDPQNCVELRRTWTVNGVPTVQDRHYWNDEICSLETISGGTSNRGYICERPATVTSTTPTTPMPITTTPTTTPTTPMPITTTPTTPMPITTTPTTTPTTPMPITTTPTTPMSITTTPTTTPTTPMPITTTPTTPMPITTAPTTTPTTPMPITTTPTTEIPSNTTPTTTPTTPMQHITTRNTTAPTAARPTLVIPTASTSQTSTMLSITISSTTTAPPRPPIILRGSPLIQGHSKLKASPTAETSFKESDKRVSAISIGVFAMVLLLSVFICIVLVDILTVWKDLKRMPLVRMLRRYWARPKSQSYDDDGFTGI